VSPFVSHYFLTLADVISLKAVGGFGATFACPGATSESSLDDF